MIDEPLDVEEGTEKEWISKTEKKRACKDITKFAQDLSKLTLKQIAKMGLSEEIQENLIRAIQIKAYAAKNRQIKFLGGLIRTSGEYESIKERYLKVYHH